MIGPAWIDISDRHAAAMQLAPQNGSSLRRSRLMVEPVMALEETRQTLDLVEGP